MICLGASTARWLALAGAASLAVVVQSAPRTGGAPVAIAQKTPPAAPTQEVGGGGPPGGVIFSLAVSRTNPVTLYAAPGDGVFRSTDGGASWTKADRGLRGVVCSLAVDPGHAAVVYAECAGELFKTTNGGRQWSRIAAGVTQPAVPVIAPSNSRVLLVRGDGGYGLYKSRDAGRTWQRLIHSDSPDSHVEPAFDPFNAEIVYIPDDADGVLKSRDGGRTWTASGRGIPSGAEVSAVRVHPARPDEVYAVARLGLFKSTNGGTSWSAIGPDLPENPVDVILSRASPDLLFVRAHKGTISRSDDAGAAWVSTADGLEPTVVSDVVADPVAPSTLYAGTFRGLLVTVDGGAHWTPAASAGMPRMRVRGIAIQSVNPTSIVAHGWSGTFSSDDGGNTWRRAADVPAAFTVSAYRAAQTRLPDGLLSQNLTRAPGNPLLAYASSAVFMKGAHLWRTTDGDRTWERVDQCAQGVSVSCQPIFDPNDPQTLYVISDNESPEMGGESLRRTVDGGSSWEELHLPKRVLSLSVLPTTPTTLFADIFDPSDYTRRLLLKSVDRGDHWAPSGVGLPASSEVSVVVADPANLSHLFAATDGRGVFRSIDGGATWQPTASGRPRD